ncbi:unnamed protein product, partial [Prorocentrum cordatum]
GRPRGPSPARGVAFRAARAPRHETPRARGRRTVTPWPGAQEAAACGRRCARGTRLQDSPEANRRVGSASGPGTGGRSAESVTPPGERGAGHRMAGALPLQDGRTHSSSEARGESQTPPAATVRGKRIDNLRYPTQALNAGYTGSLSTRGNQTGTKVGAGPGDPPTTRTWPRPGPPVALVRQPGGSLLQDIPRNDSAVHCSCAVHRQRVKRHGSPRRRGARTRRKASIVASGHPQVGTSPLTKRDVPASRVAVPCPHRPRGELARPRLPAGQARRPTGSLTSRRGGDSLGASVAQVACTPSLDASSQAEAGAAGPPARRPRGPQRWAARERQREAAAATLPMGRREEEETGGEKGERRREGRENNDRHKAL